MTDLLEEVEIVTAIALQHGLRDMSKDEWNRVILDMVMSFIDYMEREGIIVVDAVTGELTKDLSVNKCKSLAVDFVNWMR